MNFTDLKDVEWRRVNFLENPDETFEYSFELPIPLAEWDVFASWERARFHSMRDQLKPGMVLFDVGTEQGWCNLIYASMVGPENMVLIEPTREFWPNIRATWERNYLSQPDACYSGLLGAETTDTCSFFSDWPTHSVGPLIDRNKYQYLFDHQPDVKTLTLDDLVARCGVIPNAITMDVEGAELLVMQGSSSTLTRYRPLVWASMHPDLMQRHFSVDADEVHSFMRRQGYTGEFIAEDHEQHWLYRPL